MTSFFNSLPTELIFIIIQYVVPDTNSGLTMLVSDIKTLKHLSQTNKCHAELCSKILKQVRLHYFHRKYFKLNPLGHAVLRGKWNDARIMIMEKTFEINLKHRFHPLASACFAGHLPVSSFSIPV
jgi:hypothetical protein